MHEVVTLQFGQQANYIGTHYWNTQESYFTYAGQQESPVDHDISFRAGVGANGEETYSPRALIYDLKGAFGTLRRENALYLLEEQEHPSQGGEWSGVTIPLQLPPIAPSHYQQAMDQGLEPPQLTTETVRFWSDYNHMFYHPRSIVQMNEYELNSSLMPFERWDTGEELFASLDREHDLLDRDLRPFLEECDQLQGLQVLSGIDDAWGGFAAKYLERIADELGKGCRWAFGLHEGKRTTRERQMLQIANTAQSLYAINGTASMHLPITSTPAHLPSYVTLDTNSRWHTSALQAAMIESITLPTRLQQSQASRATFDQLETTLTNDGNRRMATTGMSCSEPSQASANRTRVNGDHDSRMVNGLDDGPDHGGSSEQPKLDIDFFPETVVASGMILGRRAHTFSNITALRNHADGEHEHEAGLGRFSEGPRSATYRVDLPFPTLSSYPPIFRFHSRPEKLAIKVSVSTTTEVANRVRGLASTARRMVGVDEREALCDGLTSMAEEYEEGWSDDDDYDED
jgi:hypothetical protein